MPLLVVAIGRVWVAAALAGAVVLAPVPALAAEAGTKPEATGGWTWPVGDGAPTVNRRFDPPAERYAAGHRGVDLVSSVGAVVRAAGAGRVTYAGLLAGRGVVVVEHGALRTTYEPVLAVVTVGDTLGAGSPVGTLAAGHPGCPAEACLHWGLRRGEEYLDPLQLVGRGRVRLLPLAGDTGPGGAGALPASATAVPSAGAATSGTTGDDPGRDWQSEPASVTHEPTGGADPAGSSAVPTSLRPAATGAADAGDGESRPAHRAAEAIVSVAALVAGLGLLAARRPPPGGPPVAPDVASAPLSSVDPVATGLPEPARRVVVDLADERRRRAG